MATINKTTPIKKANGITVNTSKIQAVNCNVVSSRNITYIVIHYTGNTKDTAKANATYFQTASRGASAHYFVDDTSIYQSVAIKNKALHCGTTGKYYHTTCRNANSIGVEMCCSGNYKISAKTQENATYLVAELCKLLGITANKVDTYILRHYDVSHKACPKQYVDNPTEFTSFKNKVKSILNSSSTSPTVPTSTFKPYLAKVTTSALNVRKGAGTTYPVIKVIKDKGTYTVIGEAYSASGSKWLQLKAGGYISANYTKKV